MNGEHRCTVREMTWSNDDEEENLQVTSVHEEIRVSGSSTHDQLKTVICPSCAHIIKPHHQSTGLQDLPGLPAGVKFDPSDQEILQHLAAKVLSDERKLHPLIHEFIPTIEGDNGICYTHPEKLPGVSKDGQVRHFFHRPSKAYTTGTRKRRKVSANTDGGETRWHKTGKTRPVSESGTIKGYKKILVLYTNYGRQRKPEKTNWVMHQYHLGDNEDEKDGELVVSKVFYQTQPRQCGSREALVSITAASRSSENPFMDSACLADQYCRNPVFVSYNNVARSSQTVISDGSDTFGAGTSTCFLRLPSNGSKGE